jgi:hypothetical protein
MVGARLADLCNSWRSGRPLGSREAASPSCYVNREPQPCRDSVVILDFAVATEPDVAIRDLAGVRFDGSRWELPPQDGPHICECWPVIVKAPL